MRQKNYNLDYFKSKNCFKIVSRKNSPLFDSFLRVGSPIKNSKLGFDNRISHHIILDKNLYVLRDEFEKLKKILKNNDKRIIDKYLLIAEKDCHNYLKIAEKIKKECGEKCNNKKLIRLYKFYEKATFKIVSHLWPPLAIEDYVLQQIEKNVMVKIKPADNPQEFNKIMQALLAPDIISFTQKRQQAILLLAVKLKNKKISELEMLKEYENYYWIADHGLEFIPETFEEFINEVKAVVYKNSDAQLKNLIKEGQMANDKRENIIRKYGLDKELIFWAKQAGKLPGIRFLRLEVIIKVAHELKETLFKQIRERLNISELENFYCWEIANGLQEGRINKKKALKRRKDGYSFAVVGNYFREFNNKEAKKLEEFFEAKEKSDENIKGNIACMGYGKGRVRIILSKNDFNKFQDGDILVVPMTTPEFVPLMKKAVAIITDEGGISCHAAIISRELGKPCIIGTKNATKILKDGDFVEVDADRGIVIIKKRAGQQG